VWQDRFLFAPGLRIAGGTDEIQRITHRRANPRAAERAPPRCPRVETRVDDQACSTTVWSQ
jgi:hypothetical protein